MLYTWLFNSIFHPQSRQWRHSNDTHHIIRSAAATHHLADLLVIHRNQARRHLLSLDVFPMRRRSEQGALAGVPPSLVNLPSTSSGQTNFQYRKKSIYRNPGQFRSAGLAMLHLQHELPRRCGLVFMLSAIITRARVVQFAPVFPVGYRFPLVTKVVLSVNRIFEGEVSTRVITPATINNAFISFISLVNSAQCLSRNRAASSLKTFPDGQITKQDLTD